MSNSDNIRITCQVCNKRRVMGTGTNEKIFGSEFNVAVYPNILMCAQCRYDLTLTAFNWATVRYKTLYRWQHGK